MSAPATPRPNLVVRELLPSEWSLLEAIPLNSRATPVPELARVMIAQDATTGALVAYWFVLTAVHVEPVWIAPEHSHRPGLIRRLWRGIGKILEELQVDIAYAVIGHHAHPENASMAQRLGFSRVPADLYFVLTRPEDPELRQKISDLVTADLAVNQIRNPPPTASTANAGRAASAAPQPESRVPEFDLSQVFSGPESPHGAN